MHLECCDLESRSLPGAELGFSAFSVPGGPICGANGAGIPFGPIAAFGLGIPLPAIAGFVFGTPLFVAYTPFGLLG